MQQGETDVAKFIVAFRKFANMPNHTCPYLLHAGMQRAVELQSNVFSKLALHGSDSRISPVGCFARGKETWYQTEQEARRAHRAGLVCINLGFF